MCAGNPGCACGCGGTPSIGAKAAADNIYSPINAVIDTAGGYFGLDTDAIQEQVAKGVSAAAPPNGTVKAQYRRTSDVYTRLAAALDSYPLAPKEIRKDATEAIKDWRDFDRDWNSGIRAESRLPGLKARGEKAIDALESFKPPPPAVAPPSPRVPIQARMSKASSVVTVAKGAALVGAGVVVAGLGFALAYGRGR